MIKADISTGNAIPVSRLLTHDPRCHHPHPAGTGVVKAGRGLQTIGEEHRHAPTRSTRSTSCGHLAQGKPGESAARPTHCGHLRYANGPQGHGGDVSHLSRLSHTASEVPLSTHP